MANSAFQSNVQSHGFGLLAERHGITVIHVANDSEETETSLTGIWNADQTIRNFAPDGRQDKSYGILRLNPADLTSYTIKDRFKIDDVVWAIESIGRELPVLEFQLSTATIDFVGRQDNYIRRD